MEPILNTLSNLLIIVVIILLSLLNNWLFKWFPVAACIISLLNPLWVNVFLIWESNSFLSVTTIIFALVILLLKALASITIVNDLPLPCVCQIRPPFLLPVLSKVWILSNVFLIPKYCWYLATFLILLSNKVYSLIISRTLSKFNKDIIVLSSSVANLPVTKDSISNFSSSFHTAQNLAGVPVVAYLTSLVLPANTNWTYLKRCGIFSFFWFPIIWEIPCFKDTELAFNSITQKGIPLTNRTISGLLVFSLVDWSCFSTTNSWVKWNTLFFGFSQSMYCNEKFFFVPSSKNSSKLFLRIISS